MTKTELRLEALRCAVARKGPSGTLADAREFLAFLTEDYTPAASLPTGASVSFPQQGVKRK